MERWCETNAIGSLHGRCRVHRAEILRLRGSCNEAESQALLACEELRPYLRRELGWPLNELGRIRLHKGDIAGAEEALLAAHRRRVGSATGSRAGAPGPRRRGHGGRLHPRRRSSVPLRVPSKERPPNTELQRAPLLEAQVEIEIAAGDIGRARSAADELELVAARFESKALIAGAALARGRVRLAEGDAAGAEQSLSEAVRLWNEVGAPYEAALARIGSRRGPPRQRQRAPGRLGAPSGPHDPRRDRSRASGDASRDVDATTGRNEQPVRERQRVSSRGRLLVGDLRGAHRPRARPQGHALPRAAPRRPRPGVPRARSRRRRDRQRAQADSSRAGPTFRARHSAMRARCSTHEPRTPTADASPRSTTTSSRRAPSATPSGPRRPTPNATSSFESSSRAVGLGGRDRRAASASERARVSVTRAIRQAMARIGEHHPQLGEHLSRTIRTGTYCAYLPDPRAPAGWDSKASSLGPYAPHDAAGRSTVRGPSFVGSRRRTAHAA